MVVIAAHTAHCEVAHVTKRVAAHTRYIAQPSCAKHIHKSIIVDKSYDGNLQMC